jgi:hypothetical protein
MNWFRVDDTESKLCILFICSAVDAAAATAADSKEVFNFNLLFDTRCRNRVLVRGYLIPASILLIHRYDTIK